MSDATPTALPFDLAEMKRQIGDVLADAAEWDDPEDLSSVHHAIIGIVERTVLAAYDALQAKLAEAEAKAKARGESLDALIRCELAHHDDVRRYSKRVIQAEAERDRLRAVLDDAISVVGGARQASMGSIRDTYVPQVAVARVEKWRAALRGEEEPKP